MGIILKFVYKFGFLYFFLPMFILYIIGKPRFIVKILNKILELREPVFHYKIFGHLSLFLGLNAVFNYYRKIKVGEEILEFVSTGAPNLRQILEPKYREQSLYERNFYLFVCLSIMLIIFLKLSFSYKEIIQIEEECSKLEKEFKQKGGNVNELAKSTPLIEKKNN